MGLARFHASSTAGHAQQPWGGNECYATSQSVSDVAKNVAHALPGGNTYTLDGTDNGLNMWVVWRKLFRDPGPNTTQSNDYDETSTTSITPYEKLKDGDSINYMILQ